MAYKYSERGSHPVSLIALHSAEGARTAAALGAYFQRADVQASSHVGIDGSNTLQFVPYAKAAWTLRSGNPISENAEMCAFARWTRAQWLSGGVVDGVVNPRAMVSRAATWARSRALARGIPLTRLTPIQVGQNSWGLIDHSAWTIGKKDGTHTDVGGGFPWDVFMQEVTAGAEGELVATAQEIEDIATAVTNKVWSMAGWHPDVPAGIKMGDQVAYTNHYANMIPGLVAAVAAIANDQDITPDALKTIMSDAIAEHSPTAEQIALALKDQLNAGLGETVRQLFAETMKGDDAAEADALSERFLTMLTAKLVGQTEAA